MLSEVVTVKNCQSKILELSLKIQAEIFKAPNKNYLLEFKELREKRSLNANAYAWKLISEIAAKLTARKEDIYFYMLKDYGSQTVISIKSDIVVSGFFKYYEEIGQSIINKKPFTHYKIYKGSSEYDTKEMSAFINGIVYEAKELGIETLTPAEVASMNNSWEIFSGKNIRNE